MARRAAAVKLDTVKTAQTSEVAVLIPTEQPQAAAPASTQRRFGGLSMAGALLAAALAVGFVFHRLKKRG